MSGLDIRTGSQVNETIIGLLEDESLPIRKDLLELMSESTNDQIAALESFTSDLQKVTHYIERLKVRKSLIDERLKNL